jgi:hypothetical protein
VKVAADPVSKALAEFGLSHAKAVAKLIDALD